MEEQLEIINENDEVIGIESRENVHTHGLLHREVHVWFYTPKGEIIFQHRAKDKDTFPDLLDATVGGHVDPGMTYEETALKEMMEETGIAVNISDLKFLRKMKGRSIDSVTHKINNAYRMQYAYLYTGEISDLKIEEGKGLGFEAWLIDKILHLSDEDKKRFIPRFMDPDYIELFQQIRYL
jgi:isopentenyl-diphosphate Delta-isomerase